MLTQRQHIISWLLLTMFFCVHYFVRVAPSYMTLELMKTYSITPKHIGLLTGCYFMVYTMSQIPVGYILKKFSPRNIAGTACMGCAVMAYCFSLSPTFPIAMTSLLTYAFFGSFGFVGAVTYASKNIPNYSSILVGLTQSLAMGAGALAATTITYFVTRLVPWQTVTQGSATALALLSVLIFFIVPNIPPEAEVVESIKSPKGSCEKEPSIYCNMQTWTNALYAGFIYYPLMALLEGGLGVSILESIHQHSRGSLSTTMSIIFAGWLVGGPLAGVLCDRYGRTTIMRYSAICGIIFLAPALFVPMSWTLLSTCLFFFSLTNTGIIGCYSIAADMHGPKNASVSIAISNMATILIGSIFLSVLPWILEMTSIPTFVDGIPIYSGADYQRVFGVVMLGSPVIALICASLTKDPAKKVCATTC